jgi:hypothetical protein
MDFLATAVSPDVYNHIGATLADTVLQAGLNYRNVVLPRVVRLKKEWPTSCIMSGFLEDLMIVGAHQMLDWKHSEKPQRLVRLARFLANRQIENEIDLREWLSDVTNPRSLLNLSGIGPKSVDYLNRLVGGATVAVDRHVTRFVAGICPGCKSYDEVRQVVCYAADFLEIERAFLDHAIWRFMAA